MNETHWLRVKHLHVAEQVDIHDWMVLLRVTAHDGCRCFWMDFQQGDASGWHLTPDCVHVEQVIQEIHLQLTHVAVQHLFPCSI